MSVMKLRRSWFEATARQRLAGLLDPGSFVEFLPPGSIGTSPHLAKLDLPGAFDDGVVIGAARLDGQAVLVAAQEGQFMGGAVGEIHGAKLLGLLRRAESERPAAVLLLIDSGGVRLHEANAGLIALSELMRGVLATRAAGVPVLALIGGQCGAFGGMGIVARLCSVVLMSEEGRLSLSGPEVIETVAGVEEFDARDRALVWRVTGGKHRYLTGDADALVDDEIGAWRAALVEMLPDLREPGLALATLQARQAELQARRRACAGLRDGLEVWARLGLPDPARVPLLDTAQLVALAQEGDRSWN